MESNQAQDRRPFQFPDDGIVTHRQHAGAAEGARMHVLHVFKVEVLRQHGHLGIRYLTTVHDFDHTHPPSAYLSLRLRLSALLDAAVARAVLSPKPRIVHPAFLR
jgi:hypothetical protein